MIGKCSRWKLEASLYSFSKGDLDSSKENVSKFYNVKFKFNQLSLLKTKGAMTRSKARCGANRVNAISIFLSPIERRNRIAKYTTELSQIVIVSYVTFFRRLNKIKVYKNKLNRRSKEVLIRRRSLQRTKKEPPFFLKYCFGIIRQCAILRSAQQSWDPGES